MKSRASAAFESGFFVRLVLVVSGLTAIAITATILVAPGAFYSGYGIDLSGNATLANELKAPAGALLVAGLVIMTGVFRRAFAIASLATATIVYLSYGISRVTSIVLDGMPHDGMVWAAGIELVIGGACLLSLLNVRSARSR